MADNRAIFTGGWWQTTPPASTNLSIFTEGWWLEVVVPPPVIVFVRASDAYTMHENTFRYAMLDATFRYKMSPVQFKFPLP